MAPSGRLTHRLLALLVVVTLASGACTHGSRPYAIAGRSSYGPGTPLPDGLVVAEGTTLLGMPIFRPQGGGWIALTTLADGTSPNDVFERYRTRLTASGGHVYAGTGLESGYCQRSGAVTACSGSGGPPDHPARVTVARDSTASGAPQPALVLGWGGDPASWSARRKPLPARGTPARVGTRVPVPKSVSSTNRLAFVVEDGSEPVTLPMLDLSGLGGWIALLRVTGDPDVTLDRYAAQFAGRQIGILAAPPNDRLRTNSYYVRTVSRYGSAGGEGVDLTVARRDGVGTYLLIEYHTRS